MGKSMVDELLSSKKKKSISAQMHKGTDALEESIEKPPQRLHCFIRKDLNDWLIEEVARRKKDQANFKGWDSKRAVVEEALEAFFSS